MSHLITLINYEAVNRTAPATPGLLITGICHWEVIGAILNIKGDSPVPLFPGMPYSDHPGGG